MSTIKDFQIIAKLGTEVAIHPAIGQGAFSTVYRAKRISDGQEYAIKKVNLGRMTQKEKENSLNEVRLLASIE